MESHAGQRAHPTPSAAGKLHVARIELHVEVYASVSIREMGLFFPSRWAMPPRRSSARRNAPDARRPIKLPTLVNADGSINVARMEDDEASNSGLLDLVPSLPSTRIPSTQSVHTPVLDDDAVRMPPPLLGKERARKVSRSDAPRTTFSTHAPLHDERSVSSDESNVSVVVHDQDPPKAPVSDPTPNLPMRLRRWMHDAMKQHMYGTAIFWGQQVVALETSEAAYNDAYWLAQAYFLTHQYERAEQLLTTPLRCGAVPLPSDSHGETPVGTRGDALHAALTATRASSVLPPQLQERRRHADTYASVAPRQDAPKSAARTRVTSARRRKRSPSPSDPFQVSQEAPIPMDDEFSRLVVRADASERPGPCLVNWSAPCRYLAAQCQVRMGQFHEALALTGEDHTRWTGHAMSAKTPALDGGLKLGSSVCHLRGQIYLRLDEPAKAKEAFMLALALDVKNYDSFVALVHGSLLGEEEQWSFVQTLEYAAQAGAEDHAQADMEWVRLMYTTQLSQRMVQHALHAAHARQSIVNAHEGMRSHPPVLYSFAEQLWQAMRFEDAFTVTQHILSLDAGFFLALPIHLGCMYYLPRLRPSLFLLAHKLTEAHPDSCEAWYAVGIWYAAAHRWSDARRYFSKASLLDPRFVPSWIAFGHSFALEGESDQAITAYSTAARKFPQAGLPRLFIGMEQLVQGNRSLALLFLESAAEELESDPLCANERGVALFLSGQVTEAMHLFLQAIQTASETQHPASAWSAVHLNLGMAYRRLHRDDDARECFLRVIELDAACAPAYIALGMCAHRQGDLAGAVGWYHEGLGIDPRDPVGTELLAIALDARAAQGLPEALALSVDETSVSMEESSAA